MAAIEPLLNPSEDEGEVPDGHRLRLPGIGLDLTGGIRGYRGRKEDETRKDHEGQYHRNGVGKVHNVIDHLFAKQKPYRKPVCRVSAARGVAGKNPYPPAAPTFEA
jgi:hypothetical protein